MKLVGERTITEKQVDKVLDKIAGNEMSKGAGIREMFAGGMSVKEISSRSGIRYNHVYNVVKNEILVHGLEVEATERSNGNTKKSQILELYKEGKSITDISAELKCLYNYVWQIIKAAKMSGEIEAQSTTIVVTDDLIEDPKPSKPRKSKKVS